MSKITFFNLSSSGGSGGVTDVTATSPITSSGGITPDISTSMNTNKLIGRSSSGIGVMEEISVGSGLDLFGGVLTNTATPTPLGYYGAWHDNLTQSASANNTGYGMIFRSIDLSNGVSVVSNGTNLTRITFAHTGIYNLQFSSQFENIDNAEHYVTIWLRKNNIDVDDTSSFLTIPKRKGTTDYGRLIASWNFVFEAIGGEYFELIWSTDDYTQVTMPFLPATAFAPLTPSVIMTVTQQSGIMAGTGITALNGLTADVQTFATGTSGSDFAISSVGSTHTFNLPTASASNRGALSSSDWTTFNNKQATINLTTTGTSGASTLIGNTLNIPQYSPVGQSVNILNNIIAQALSGAASPTTRYHAISGTISTLTTAYQIPLATSCTFQNFIFRIYSIQPASGSLVLTLQKNAVDTALTITIASGSAIGNYTDNTNSVSFVAGDTWQIKIVQNATSGSTNLGGYSFKVSNV